jgi:CHAT domain-containing protein
MPYVLWETPQYKGLFLIFSLKTIFTMTTTRRFISIFVLFSTILTLHAQTTPPLSIRQPFEALSKEENQTLLRIDTFLSKNEWQAPIHALDSILDERLQLLITKLATMDTTQARIALPLAIARVFKANDLALYEEFHESTRLSDVAIAALIIHARDTCSLYALAMAHVDKAYCFQYLVDLEEAVLESDKAIEVFRRIGYASNIIAERLNKSKHYADMGDETAGLKELNDYDRLKIQYPPEEYVKLDIFAMAVRSALVMGKGNQEQLLGEIDSAQLTYQKALLGLQEAGKNLEKYKAVFSPEELLAARHMVQLNMAGTYTNIKIPHQADSILACIARAEAWGQSRSIQDNLVKSLAWTSKRNFEAAKTTIQSVMHDLIDARTDTSNIFSTPSVNVQNIQFLQLMPTAYFQKGQLLVAMYDSSKAQHKENLEYLKHAFYCYQKAITAIDTLRMVFSTDATMQNVVKKYTHIYSPTLLTASKLYQETNNSTYLDTMLLIGEQHKTFTLRQTIYSRTNRERYTGVTRRLYEQEQQLKRDLIVAQNAFGGNQNAETLQKLNAAHANYRQFKESLKKMPVNTEGGRYYAERFADSVPRIKDIQRDWLNTQKGEVPRVFLSFTFSPTHIIALLVTPDKAQPYIREITPQLWTLLKRFTTSIESETTFPNAAAYALYDVLLKDVLLDVPQNAHLIISAEGLLLRVPFEALLTQAIDSKDKNYPDMPFLIKKHRVSYLPSLTTQMWLRTFHASAKPIKQHIGIVKGHYVKSENLIAPLLNTADSVAYFYNKSATVFDNNKTSFMFNDKEELGFTDLFFALHGEASANNPLDYALILKDNLTKNEDSTLARLTVAKIQRMKFKKLNSVVFGACETQHGELDLGEGVFSIARAFQGLGCRHVVCTLNSVPVESTAQLINNFYYHYNKPSALSKSLHEAKIGYLSAKTIRREEKHPHYWANLIYLGDD